MICFSRFNCRYFTENKLKLEFFSDERNRPKLQNFADLSFQKKKKFSKTILCHKKMIMALNNKFQYLCNVFKSLASHLVLFSVFSLLSLKYPFIPLLEYYISKCFLNCFKENRLTKG